MTITLLPGFLWHILVLKLRSGAMPVIGALIVAGTATAVFTSGLPGGGGGGGGALAANLWITTTGNDSTCTRSSSTIALGSASPCATLGKAYSLASAGDIVGMEAGSYSADTIAYRAALDGLSPSCDPRGEWGTASSANCIKVVPDGGTVVWTGDLTINSPDIWLDGTATGSPSDFSARTYNIAIDTGGGTGFSDFTKHGNIEIKTAASGQVPSYITIEGLHSHTFHMQGANHILYKDSEAGSSVTHWLGGSIGNCDAPENTLVQQAAVSPTVPVDHISIDSVWIHGQNTDDSTNCHYGGLTLNSQMTDIAIRKTGFAQNVVYNIQQNGTGSVTNMTIENSYFGCGVGSEQSGGQTTCSTTADINLQDGLLTNWLIRYNAFYGHILQRVGGSWSNGRIIGNVMFDAGTVNQGAASCDTNITWDYNIGVTTPTCGTNWTDVASRATVWTDPTNATDPNFHLVDTTNAANNYVVPTTSDYAIATDIDGTTRPVGTNRDAGVDEQ